MQRSILVPLILAAIAFGVYWERVPLMDLWRQTVKKASTLTASGGRGSGAGDSADAQATASRYSGGTQAPGESMKAAPGTFFMLQRAKVVSGTGVKAVNPGEQVRLLERLPNGKLRVTIGNADFEVSKSQVTDDLEAAREAERRFHTAPDQSL